MYFPLIVRCVLRWTDAADFWKLTFKPNMYTAVRPRGYNCIYVPLKLEIFRKIQRFIGIPASCIDDVPSFLTDLEKKCAVFFIAHNSIGHVSQIDFLFLRFSRIPIQCEQFPIGRERNHRAKWKLSVANHFLGVTDRVTSNDVRLYKPH
jgi:hypothetical protein